MFLKKTKRKEKEKKGHGMILEQPNCCPRNHLNISISDVHCLCFLPIIKLEPRWPSLISAVRTRVWRENGVFSYSDQDLASNSMDQHTYSLIASLVVVELDWVQFDYIHWVRLIGTTEWIRTLTKPHWYGFASALTTTPDWTFGIKLENKLSWECHTRNPSWVGQIKMLVRLGWLCKIIKLR